MKKRYVIIKCECGIEHEIKIPFRLRKKVDKIEVNCGCGKTIKMVYADKLEVINKNVI